jgi:hypothetical protein
MAGQVHETDPGLGFALLTTKEGDMDSVEVSSADIARLAGVRPTAVSNWRRRHSDFPAPVGGTEKSPRFSLDEVREWLAGQGRAFDVDSQRAFAQAVGTAAIFTPVADTLRNALFALLDHAGDDRTDERGWRRRLQADTAKLAEAHPGLTGAKPFPELDTPQVTMLNAALEAAAEGQISDLADKLYDETLARRLGKGDTATPAYLADLMVGLAAPGDGPFVDIACGAGSILMAAARHGCREVAGIETTLARAQLAALRIRAAGFEPPVRLRIHAADALATDPFGPGTAAAVVTNPPFNERSWAQDVREDEPWWEYGIPTGKDSELAWVQRALHQLRPGGTAVLAMPPASAVSPSGRRIRRRLLSDGVLRAVIALPRGGFHGTALAPHLWLLTRNEGPTAAQSVLTADFGSHITDHQQPDWDRITEAALAAWSAFKSGDEPAGDEYKTVPVVTLLSDDVDLTPGRLLPLRLPKVDYLQLERWRSETIAQLHALDEQLRKAPGTQPAPNGPVRWETFEALVRSAEVSLHRGLPSVGKPNQKSRTVRTVRTVRANRDFGEGEAIVEAGQHVPRIREGDLLAEVLGERLRVRQVTDDDLDAAPGFGTVIIRTDPRQIDPAFLAGFLASALAQQQLARGSTSLGVNTYRDLLRIRVALPGIEDQYHYTELFTALAGITAEAASLTTQIHGLANAWRDGAWAAIIGGDPAE